MAAPRYIIEAARRYVRVHFLDMQGMRYSGAPAPATKRYIVTARRCQATADGQTIERVERVTLDAQYVALRASASK